MHAPLARTRVSGKGPRGAAFPGSQPPSCSLLRAREGGGPGGVAGSRGGGGPGGEAARCQRKQPGAPRPRLNPQKFPSASAARGAGPRRPPARRVNSGRGRSQRGRAAILWPRVRGAPGPRAWTPGPPPGAGRVALCRGTCRHPPATPRRAPRPGPPSLPPGARPGVSGAQWPRRLPRGPPRPASQARARPAAPFRPAPSLGGRGRPCLWAGTSIFGGDQATA